MKVAVPILVSKIMFVLLYFQKNTGDLHLLNLNWQRWVLNVLLKCTQKLYEELYSWTQCVFLYKHTLFKRLIFYCLLTLI